MSTKRKVAFIFACILTAVAVLFAVLSLSCAFAVNGVAVGAGLANILGGVFAFFAISLLLTVFAMGGFLFSTVGFILSCCNIRCEQKPFRVTSFVLAGVNFAVAISVIAAFLIKIIF